MRKTHFPAKGFTLVELMVTVVVVGILVSVAVPSFNKSREVALARDAQSMLNMMSVAQRQLRTEKGQVLVNAPSALQNSDNTCTGNNACPANRVPQTTAHMICCNYMGTHDWDSSPYTFSFRNAGNAVATRRSGSFAGATYVITPDGVCSASASAPSQCEK